MAVPQNHQAQEAECRRKKCVFGVREFMHNLGVFSCLYILTSCITTGVPDVPVNLNQTELGFFRSCAPLDGGLSISSYAAGKETFQVRMDWVSQKDSSWKAEFSDLLGRKLLGIESTASSLLVDGKHRVSIPKFTTDGNGFLEIEGKRVGLLVSEIPCLLGFTFPQAWASKIKSRRYQGVTTTLDISEKKRVISLDLQSDYNYKLAKSCARIGWSLYFGLKSMQFEWCTEIIDGTKTSTLSGPEGKIISWKNDDH